MRHLGWLLLLGVGCSRAGSDLGGALERAEAPLPEADAALRERFAAVLGPRATTGGLRVELPRRVSNPMFLADDASGLSVEVTMAGASDAEGRALDGGVAFATAGGAVLLRRTAFGAEDFVALDSRPVVEELRYSLALGDRIAGLRLVEHQLELLDAGGAPRLRVMRPDAIDAHGARHAGTLALEGCAADASPEAPWGRPVTPPRASHCELVVRWGEEAGEALVYPVIVDPGWTSTDAMAVPRVSHTASLLPNGKVLVAGGSINTSFQPTSTCELYDPVTATWANAAALAQARAVHTASVLHDGTVLVAGGSGQGAAVPTSQRYASTQGFWGPEVMTISQHTSHAATVLADGRVLVAGGFISSFAEVYNPASDVWSPTNDLPSPRSEFALVTIGARRSRSAATATAVPSTRARSSTRSSAPGRPAR